MLSEPYFVIGPSQSLLLGCAFQEFASTRSFADWARERSDRFYDIPNTVPHTKSLLDFLVDRLEPFYGSPCDLYATSLPEAALPGDGQRIELGNGVIVFAPSTPDIVFREFGGGDRWRITVNFLGRLGNLLRDNIAWRPIDAWRFPRDAADFVDIYIRTLVALSSTDHEQISALNRPDGADDLAEVWLVPKVLQY